METIKFIGILAATWLFTQGAAPVQFLKKLAGIHNINEPKSLVKKVLRGLVNCSLCMGFWIGTAYYFLSGHSNWFLWGCLVSVAAELFTRILNTLFNRILNDL